MAKFCNDDCEAICDFCVHYKDLYRDIDKVQGFAGEGICDADSQPTDACGGNNCEDFECFRIEGK